MRGRTWFLIGSMAYWAVSLTGWGLWLLGDVVGDCLAQPHCIAMKQRWMVADGLWLVAIVGVYAAAIAMRRRHHARRV